LIERNKKKNKKRNKKRNKKKNKRGRRGRRRQAEGDDVEPLADEDGAKKKRTLGSGS